MKLSAYAWNIADGRLPRESLTKYQQFNMLHRSPSILSFLGYVFYFPALFVGPSFDYAEYERWLNLSMFESVDRTKMSKKKRTIPSSVGPAMKIMVMGWGFLLLFMIFVQYVSVDYTLSRDFMRHSLLWRIWYIQPLSLSFRLKYYGIWYLAEGACILSGLGYNGIDPISGKQLWNRVTNVSIYEYETAQNMKALIEAWNKNTNRWLRNYVYLRVSRKDHKPGFISTLVTFATSATWHGFYPGYYLTFIFASFAQTVARQIRRTIRPFFLTEDLSGPGRYKLAYDIIGFIVTQITVNYIVLPFNILTIRNSILVWSRLAWFGHIAIFGAMIILQSPIKKFLSQKLKKRSGKAMKERLDKRQ